MALQAILMTGAAAPGHANPSEKRVALVVGQADYVHVPALGNSGRDAALMARTLSSLGFELVDGKAVLDVRSKSEFEALVVRFREKLQGASVAVFYYAGHGLQIRDKNWLVPIDADPHQSADAEVQMVDADFVLDQMDASGARLKLMILDACRNNPFAGRGLRSTGGGLAQMQAPEGTLISYATQPGNTAWDGPPGGDGPFALALAETMKRPGLDVLNLFNDVAVQVSDATKGEQQPWTSNSPIKGTYYLVNPSQGGNERPTAKAKTSEQDFQVTAPSASSSTISSPGPAHGPLSQSRTGDSFRDCADCPEMMVIPPGRFMMGTPEADRDGWSYEGPQHTVTLQQRFALGKYLVTRGEFETFAHETNTTADGCWRRPGFDQTDRDPVICVSWLDAQAYVKWLNGKVRVQASATQGDGPYRIPSEAEWEYAARAGTSTAYYWGEAPGTGNADCRGCGTQWDDKRTAPAGSFKPNPWGLYDMSGNAWEWMADCWNKNYSGAPGDGSAWRSGDCGQHVLRGGAWMSYAGSLRSADRSKGDASIRYYSYGFRVAKTLP